MQPGRRRSNSPQNLSGIRDRFGEAPLGSRADRTRTDGANRQPAVNLSGTRTEWGGRTEGARAATTKEPPAMTTSQFPKFESFEQAEFEARHIGTTEADRVKMLGVIGFPTMAELMDAAIPGGIRHSIKSTMPTAATESEV